MQIFNNNEQVANIYHRSFSLYISKDFAKEQVGNVFTSSKQGSEQANRRRELLEVEEQAKQAKVIEEYGKSHFKNQVKSKFFADLNKQVNVDFDNKEQLFEHIIKVDDAAPAILDILSVRAASINRIVPLAKSLPWLADELVKLVNKPQYRKRADVKVTDAKIALSYIGLDNLKMVVPIFMLKHWLPNSTSPYPLMKRKLWNDSLTIAMITKLLAQQAGEDEHTAFMAGMLSNIGYMIVTRCVLTHHQQLHSQELKRAYEDRDKRLHDVLVELDTSPELLLEHLLERSAQITADVIEAMKFERLNITEAIFDLAYSPNWEKMNSLAQYITKARAYVAMRSLAKEDLVNSDEAKQLLSTAKITAEEIALLKKSDIDHVKLNFK